MSETFVYVESEEGLIRRPLGRLLRTIYRDVNEHDSKTLDAALTSASSNRTKKIEEAICDRGYRGKKEVNGITISIPGKELKRDTKYQKDKVNGEAREGALG